MHLCEHWFSGSLVYCLSTFSEEEEKHVIEDIVIYSKQLCSERLNEDLIHWVLQGLIQVERTGYCPSLVRVAQSQISLRNFLSQGPIRRAHPLLSTAALSQLCFFLDLLHFLWLCSLTPLPACCSRLCVFHSHSSWRAYLIGVDTIYKRISLLGKISGQSSLSLLVYLHFFNVLLAFELDNPSLCKSVPHITSYSHP